MSIKAVNWALNNVKCSPDYKVILLAMAERADDHGICFPSQTDLQQKTCIPLRSLKRKMSHLKDLTVFTVITKQVQTNLRRNSYRLRLEESFDLLDSRTVEPENNGAKLAPSSQSPETLDGATVAPLIVPDWHHSNEQWCHSSGTHNGATQVAHEPPSNHQLKPISNNNSAADVFSQSSDSRLRVTMNSDWWPSPHVFDQLLQHNIPGELAEDWVPEFAIYHRGKTDRQGAFDAKFLKNALHQYRSKQCEPQALPLDWEPDQRTTQLLRVDGITTDFIWQSTAEFKLYWHETGERRHGWQSRFLQHCRGQWARRSVVLTTPGAGGVGEPIAKRMFDRSWATGTGG